MYILTNLLYTIKFITFQIQSGRQDSIVGTATTLRAGQLLFFKTSRLAQGPIQLPNQWYWVVSPMKREGGTSHSIS
jgi:hypothetical protein